jgi:GlpG protein
VQRPPPIRDAPKFPITTLIALAAAGVTIAWWNHVDISALLEVPGTIEREPWRLVTSVLPHGSMPHLFFNLYWFWAFGTLVERTFGSLRLLGIVVLLGAASSAAEWALFEGGVGLSGVGYGLFGMLWALKRRPGFESVIDRNTVSLFVVWFFICIVTTWTGLMNIANVAHAAGAGVGYLLGMCVAAEPGRRAGRCAALIAVLAVIACAATVARPWVNLSPPTTRELFDRGTSEIKAKHYDNAVRILERAAKQEPDNASVQSRLGVAYEYAGRRADAIRTFEEALRLNPSDKEVAAVLQRLRTTPSNP